MDNATVENTIQDGVASPGQQHMEGDFQIFECLRVVEANALEGCFELDPLEKGYGRTLGNALRRVLLASLEGYAITSLRIPGIQHEFSTIKGVVEDVVQLVLNLKQVVLKKVGHAVEEKLLIKITDQTVVRAGDLEKFTSSFEVMNPDLILCHLDKNTHFECEVTLAKGRGYRPAEEHEMEERVIGMIPIDAIFTPLKNVAYRVENTRVGDKTDYDKLILDIATDGSIAPQEALHAAADILIRHLLRLNQKQLPIVPEKLDAASERVSGESEELAKLRRLLETPIADLDLSVRARNCLKTSDIDTLGDLVALQESELIKLRNLGKKSLQELKNIVQERNLTFGTDINRYSINKK